MCSMGALPPELAEAKPGPALATMLAAVEGATLSGYERVVVLEAHQRMVSHFQAHLLGEMAAIADVMNEIDAEPDLAYDSAAAEIRAALHLTQRAADADLALAVELKQRLPRVWEALKLGVIDLRRARVIVFGTAHLTEEAARNVVDLIIDRAARMTTGQLHVLLRRVCLQADPDDATKRYAEATADRRIVVEPTEDGTAHLFGLNLPPDRAEAAMRRINDLAQSLKTGPETRTLDQLRADVFLDLLEGNTHLLHGRPGTVDIHVDLETLARLNDHPGELAGYGPVIADIARQVAENSQHTQWRWTLTDPDSGQVIDDGTTRRRPTGQQQRRLISRDPKCIFPGCRMPATDCDLDHSVPWAQGGPTTTDNLAPLCRHDHQIKHRSGWTYQRLSNGDYQWTSRLGHTYTTSGLPP